jgi:hypothetical protein
VEAEARRPGWVGLAGAGRRSPRDRGGCKELSAGRLVKRGLTSLGSPGLGPLHRYEPGRHGLGPDLELYDLLESVAANPVVALNRAIAITERDGPQHRLAALEAIVGMERSHLWHAALADHLRRLRRTAEAAGELEIAAAFAPTECERRLLLSRLLDVRPEPT